MADVDKDAEEPVKKASRLPLVLGLALALIGGGGGFYATWSGMILGTEDKAGEHDDAAQSATPDVAYVAVDPLTVSLRSPGPNQHLRFRASLETTPDAQHDVELLLPRVTDVLNSYLRALETGDIEDPAALTRLRAQMLRRVQVVTGAGKVNDLLIMEFVLN